MSVSLEHLARQLLQWSGSPQRSMDSGEARSSGIPALDALLPQRGLPPGTLLESLSEGAASGAAAVAFAALAHRVEADRSCVVIDAGGWFYPPAIHRLEKLLERTIVVHPANEGDALWALEQSLRCPEAGGVICRLGRVPPHAFRRLKLAVESGGGLGWLLRPAEHLRQPSWADVRLRVRPRPALPCGGNLPPEGRLLSLEVLSCRGRLAARSVELELDDVTGHVRLVPGVAPAAGAVRAARA